MAPTANRKHPGRRFIICLAGLAVCLLAFAGYRFWNCLPHPLFAAPYSTVVVDRDQNLLGAAIATDEQWRFAPSTSVPPKFIHAITCFEDKRFFRHPGVDPLAVLRAVKQNLAARRIVSGASTITMQVIRLARKRTGRTLGEKITEAILALRLDLALSKDQILALYAGHAPFGGNVVGLEAAAWRYFGRTPERLSWAETALLAVLPNNPALIHPGRNRPKLKQKRDRLLKRLQLLGLIDALTYRLARQEPLPQRVHALPRFAPHLLTRIRLGVTRGKNTQSIDLNNWRYQTTLIKALQRQSLEVVDRHLRRLKTNGIHNAAALILDVPSGEVLAYIGNGSAAPDPNNPRATDFHENQVDVVIAPRSSGSILKPLLYAGMLGDGEHLPSQLVPDVPTRVGGFAPENFSRTYQGAVPAYMALARSLNIPAVRMLRQYGVARFYRLLKSIGLTTLHRNAENYGLTLILGGAETTLWDITGVYAGLARSVMFYAQNRRSQPVFHSPRFLITSPPPRPSDPPLDAAACYLTLQAMVEVTRPGVESGWRQFSSSQTIAWKTGTSYGLRDGWAVGVTPRYAVGVWVGNADGEGRPGLTGIATAAPILFDLFGLLDGGGWFAAPEADLLEIPVCTQSGFRAGPDCARTRLVNVHRAGLRTKRCPHCRVIHMAPGEHWRVHGDCEPIADIRAVKWFSLPPVMAWYYQKKHARYRPLPPFRKDCRRMLAGHGAPSLTLIYPEKNSRIYVPRELSGNRGRTVFLATHRHPERVIYWHLNDRYLGQTTHIHQMALAPAAGRHKLTLVDENGEFLETGFIVIEAEKNRGG